MQVTLKINNLSLPGLLNLINALIISGSFNSSFKEVFVPVFTKRFNMLFRVILALGDKKLSSTLGRQISGEDVFVNFIDGSWNGLLEQLPGLNADMLIVGFDIAGNELDDGVMMLHSMPENPILVLLSEDNQPETRAGHIASGWDVVLSSKLPPDKLSEAIKGIIERHEERIENPFDDLPRLVDFVSKSQLMKSFMHLVRKVVNKDSSLLILGETGVGKERLARAIHRESPRADYPFIPLNCAALPETLLESELFGHEQGAFTGASKARRGAFELAHKGTVFLDEIGDMPLKLQSKLLRVIQEREFCRLGGEKNIKVDVRIMAATNHDLKQEVQTKEFRKDLFFRLSVISLTIPPLRDRQEDIPNFVNSCLKFLRTKIGTDVSGISPGAMEKLLKYDWPGNIRELINVLERAMLLCDGNTIHTSDLPEEIAKSSMNWKSSSARTITPDASFIEEYINRNWRDARGEILAEVEKLYFARLLEKNLGNISLTAQAAGMTTRALFEKMRRHNLDKKDFKP